jgi:NAD+ diphosphatase
MKPYAYCPHCATPLIEAEHGGRLRRACPDASCGFIHWDNPVPVVAAVVEHEGKIILARNVAWPPSFYALITGFLERDESPEIGVQREVEEELGLQPQGANYIGVYEFTRNNQLIVAYHVPATGTVKLNEELADWKHVAYGDVRYWPAGTGYALRDWLRSQGVEAPAMDWPKR